MTITALCSVKASPGVTTTIQALAEVWPEWRQLVVIELDPAGGDLAARLELSPEPGLVTMAAAGRRDLTAETVLEHAQPLGSRASVLVAPPSAKQTKAALDVVAERLASVLGELDEHDVLVDCGRLDTNQSLPVAAGAAREVLVVLRPTSNEVAHVASRLDELGGSEREIGLLLVGEPSPGARYFYPAAEVSATLERPVVGVLAEDDRAAAVLDGRRRGERLLRKSTLLRSASDLALSLAGHRPPVAENPAGEAAATIPSLATELAG